MYISDTNRSRIWITYGLVSIFCVIFALVYEHFSHDVYSVYMMTAFLWPLLLGMLPALIIRLIRRFTKRQVRDAGTIARNLQASGIAALTVGSIFTGVLEIYGTTNSLVYIYWAAGSIMVTAGLIAYVFNK